MLSVGMTIGAIAMTRLSTAAVSQVVQPRFEAPVTTNDSAASTIASLGSAFAAATA